MNLFAPIIIAASVLLSSTAFAQEDQRVADAKAAAVSWLALIDAGEYAQSWRESAGPFRAAVTQENWLASASQARKPFGAVKARTLNNARLTHTMAGAPDGDYVIIQYDTQFSNNITAVETIVPMRDKDGSWKVSGWFIR